jgi:hypothetical protein
MHAIPAHVGWASTATGRPRGFFCSNRNDNIMAKISLGKRPSSFKLSVDIPVPGGEPDSLEFTFKYRTRVELAQMTDEHSAASKARIDALVDRMKAPVVVAAEAPAKRGRKAAAEPVEAPKSPTEAEFAAAINEGHADYILAAAEAWELSDEFSRENVLQLVDRFPGAAPAISDAYSRALKEGRLGN